MKLCVALIVIISNFNVIPSALDVTKKSEKASWMNSTRFFNIFSFFLVFCSNENSLYFQSNEDDNKTNFTDLNDDCVFLILEQLNFDDLLNMAQINGKFSTLTADEFRRKYSRLQIVIRDVTPFPNGPNELSNVGMKIDAGTIEQINKYVSNRPIKSPNIKVSKTEIEVENGDQILNIFKHFGHLIKRFTSITFSSTLPLKSELIGKLVSKYSSESLVEVEFVHGPEKMLKHITKPLINVESVTLRGNYENFNRRTIRLDNLFPTVHRLNFDTLNNFDFAPFDYHMPHLEHIFMHKIALNRGSAIPALFMKNPQIRSIDFYRVDPEFIRNVNFHLPQLETIKLSHFELRSGSIRIKNVTTFVTDFGHFTSPLNLHFPRLQTLHVVDYRSERFAEWFHFLNEHNHLRYLYFKHFNMDDQQFQQLTANLTNLVEISLEYRTELIHRNQALSSNVIVEFLRSHNKVEQLNVINFPEHCEDELQEQLEHGWNTRIVSGGLHFERN